MYCQSHLKEKSVGANRDVDENISRSDKPFLLFPVPYGIEKREASMFDVKTIQDGLSFALTLSNRQPFEERCLQESRTL